MQAAMKSTAPLCAGGVALLALLSSLACSKRDAEPESGGAATTSSATATPAVSAPKAPGPAATATPAPASSGPLASAVHPDLLDPSKASAKAPDVYKAKFTTSKGDFVVEVHRAWAPNGADRFYNLVKMGFYDDTRFFRAIDGFMVQFGISGDPTVSTKWRNATIPDDPVTQSNKRTYLSFATRGPNSRTTQVFVDYADNARLDGMGFSPFGQVTQGMDVLDKLYKGYGESASQNQPIIESQGNAFLDAKFPQLDTIKHVEITK
jgi:cyclophilin family peptidyl-prolyl cis-trans isomerase